MSILGCGWLGMPLAERLKAPDILYTVKGSTTNPNKLGVFASKGIIGYLIDLQPELAGAGKDLQRFFEADMLIIAIPPGFRRRAAGFHQQQMQAVIAQIEQSPIKEVLYISSTSVYPDLNSVLVESDVTDPAESASPELVEVENSLQQLRSTRSVGVLRLGGLLGYDRIPGKYVKGKKGLTTYHTPVNYIHRDDAVSLIVKMLMNGVSNETFNGVAPIHTNRGEVYEKTCREFGWEAPTFLEPLAPEPFKVISSEKVMAKYSFQFRYPDPAGFYYKP
ncbi:NAD-dependent dehydratase [Dyadobacter jejuensis]|uniref:NAD-dependent dehydratase n=1 Tax=Dyadobacter jejuensis TaxID=1082580 RepID=UPI001E2DEED0|nr:NAD-dependent dehydratase [Dyadobacter jejuensis]